MHSLLMTCHVSPQSMWVNERLWSGLWLVLSMMMQGLISISVLHVHV